MKEITLTEAYEILKKSPYCDYDDYCYKIVNVKMENVGLLLTISKSPRVNDALLFPIKNNEKVIVSNNSLSFKDSNNWVTVVTPLTFVDLE